MHLLSPNSTLFVGIFWVFCVKVLKIDIFLEKSRFISFFRNIDSKYVHSFHRNIVDISPQIMDNNLNENKILIDHIFFGQSLRKCAKLLDHQGKVGFEEQSFSNFIHYQFVTFVATLFKCVAYLDQIFLITNMITYLLLGPILQLDPFLY